MRGVEKRNITRKSMRLLTRIIVMVMLLTTFAQSYGGVSYATASEEGTEEGTEDTVDNTEKDTVEDTSPSVNLFSGIAPSLIFTGTTYLYINVSSVGNFSDAGCVPYIRFGGTSTYIEAILVSGSIYSIAVPAGDYTYFYVSRYYSGYGSAPLAQWNTSGQIYLSSGYNLYTATGSSALISGGTWSTYVPPQYVYNATAGTSITSATNLYTVNATFYDYFNDTEYANGWRTSTYADSHSFTGTGTLEKFTKFNNAIGQVATANSTWQYPLYFGILWNMADGSTGLSGSNMVRFYNIPNNSGWLSSSQNSVVGLTSQTLSSSNKLMMYNGVQAPYFDEDWLTSNKLGVVVNTPFPLRKTTKSASGSTYTYYEFDSTGGTDNVWFRGYTSGDLTMNYGAGTSNSVYDALGTYGGSGASNGIGFFPFDAHTNNGGSTSNNAYDFGFGMRMDVEFTLGKNGQVTLADGTSTTDAIFDFSGDDDLWVFVDGVLVLDLGGAHAKATGSINFASKTSTVSTGVNTFTGQTRNGAFPSLFGSGTSAFDNNDTTKVHTLTIFYMERGMVESNLKFGFNFAPVGNEFISEKVVDTANVNVALQQALLDSDEFTFTLSTSDAEGGTYTLASGKKYQFYDASKDTTTELTTPTAGTYTLQTADSAQFIDQFETGKWFNVKESYLNHTYTQSWKAVDTVTGLTIATGTGTDSTFQFLTTDTTSTFAATRIKLTYTNTPAVGSLKLTKQIVDENGAVITPAPTDTFDFTVYVNLLGTGIESDYKIYPLTYTKNGAATVYTATNGIITSLGANDYITIAGIPTGAQYKIVESAKSGYTLYSATGGTSTDTAARTVIGTISTSNEVVFNNKKDTTPASLTLKAKKTLDGVAPTTANLYWADLVGTNYSTSRVGNAADGVITFRTANYSEAGTYTYTMSEVPGSIANVVYDQSVYQITVTVVSNSGVLSVDTITYYRIKDINGNTLASPELVSSDKDYQVTFTNTTSGSLIVKKVDSAKTEGDSNYMLSGAGFTLVKATVSTVEGVEVWSDVPGTEIIGVDNAGTFTFTKLPYGTYLLYETKAPAGYQLLQEPRRITISETTLVSGAYTEVVQNTQSPDLPKTGGAGTTAFFVLGLMFMCISLIQYIRQIRKGKINFSK